MHNLEKRVHDFTLAHNLVSRGDRVVVAVSGGADSVSLLYILHKVGAELGIDVHIAHLDHGLRGVDSAEEADYVRSLADRLELPATIERRDVESYRRDNHLSLEEAAREVRYKFLEEVAQNVGAASVAVAHNRNDHIETVLLHLLRGSGLTGLMGLKADSILRYKRVGPLRVIRPLICATRAEVEAYCTDNGLEYRTDATNRALTQTRNRIRLKLLPSLRRDFNPRIDEALDRLSRMAACDVDFIEVEAEQAVVKAVRIEGDLKIVERGALLRLQPALQRAILRRILATTLGSPKDIEAVHIEKMMELVQGEAGRSIMLPDDITFASSYQELFLGRDLASAIPLPPLDGEYLLNVPGVTELSGWRVTASITEALNQPPPEDGKDFRGESMDFDIAGADLTVRARRPGDRFRPLGMDNEKKLKDFFIDAKVPAAWRSRIPVVVNPRQIVWVAGYRLDDRVKVTPSTRRVLRLEFTQT